MCIDGHHWCVPAPLPPDLWASRGPQPHHGSRWHFCLRGPSQQCWWPQLGHPPSLPQRALVSWVGGVCGELSCVNGGVWVCPWSLPLSLMSFALTFRCSPCQPFYPCHLLPPFCLNVIHIFSFASSLPCPTLAAPGPSTTSTLGAPTLRTTLVSLACPSWWQYPAMGPPSSHCTRPSFVSAGGTYKHQRKWRTRMDRARGARTWRVVRCLVRCGSIMLGDSIDNAGYVQNEGFCSHH